MTLRIVPVVPPADGERSSLYDAWHAVYLAAELHGRERTAAAWQHDEVRVDVLADDDSRTLELWGGLDDGLLVASGYYELPRRDNRDHACIAVHVHPDHRRRGHGSALLAALTERARAAGRTLLDGEVGWAYDAGPAGAGVPGVAFLLRHGWSNALGDVMRVLDLPVAGSLLDRLAAEAAPHHAAYTLHSFVGPVPDDLVDGWAALAGQLVVEAPTGDLQLEAEDLDAALVRTREETVRRQGRTKYSTVALDADGAVVAYTDLATTVHEPGRAYQWGTLVSRPHRGHRLGLAVKVANLRLLQSERDDVTRLVTYNAEVNTHMVAVNEALGFRPVERLGEFSRTLPPGPAGRTAADRGGPA